jgi:hypothetical protein
VSSAGLLPATTTLYAQNAGRGGAIAVAPADVRTLRGTPALLPHSVEIVNGMGARAWRRWCLSG